MAGEPFLAIIDEKVESTSIHPAACSNSLRVFEYIQIAIWSHGGGGGGVGGGHFIPECRLLVEVKSGKSARAILSHKRFTENIAAVVTKTIFACLQGHSLRKSQNHIYFKMGRLILTKSLSLVLRFRILD